MLEGGEYGSHLRSDVREVYGEIEGKIIVNRGDLLMKCVVIELLQF